MVMVTSGTGVTVCVQSEVMVLVIELFTTVRVLVPTLSEGDAVQLSVTGETTTPVEVLVDPEPVAVLVGVTLTVEVTVEV